MNIVENQMNRFIELQNQRLRDLIFDDISITNINEQNITSIEIVGSGSSLNAAMSTSQYFKKIFGDKVNISTPELFLESIQEDKKIFDSGMIFVGISQTASSIATMTSLQEMKRKGIYTILITANEDFENSTIADCTIDLMASEEKIGPKSLGYTATIIRLIQLANYFANIKNIMIFEDSLVEKLENVVDSLPKIKMEVESWIKENHTWSSLDFYTIASSEKLFNANRESTLKMLEVTRKPCSEYELGEFTHGPHRLFSEKCGNIFVVENKDLTFAKRIAKFAKTKRSQTLIIADSCIDKRLVDISLSEFNVGYQIVLAIIFQTLANTIAAENGINADETVFPDFFSFVGTKVDFVKEKSEQNDNIN